jgi:hypothetical protein
MHVFVDPELGGVTGLIDWGAVQSGTPHGTPPSPVAISQADLKGTLRVHHGRQPDLFANVVEGYEPAPDVAERLKVLGSFYPAYRQAWVARLGREKVVPNPSLAMLLSKLDR